MKIKEQRTAVLERELGRTLSESSAAVRRRAAGAGAPLDEGLCCIGLMRVAQEWSDPRAPDLSAIIRGVAERMGLPPERFELFVAEQLGALLPEVD